MNEKQIALYEALCELRGEYVVDILTDWHGMQLLSDDLYDEMVNQRYLRAEGLRGNKMRTAYEKYTEYMNHENEFIITPTRKYFENNTIEEIELIVEQYPNIFDYEYILDQYATDDSIQGFNTFNEALEELKRLDPKNWSESQKVEDEGVVRGALSEFEGE